MSNRFDQEYSIFSEAMLRSPAERRAFLLAACGDQPDLQQRVEALLDAHDGASGFLDTSASGKFLEEPAVDQISRFNLIRRIGEGGCGIVYLADQLEPIRRTVAVKVIKPGMDSRNIVARFESERQVLALMDHPYIASVFDAGTTKSGRPFFAMEYVQGTRITDFCDHNSLTVPERLELLIQVAQAIQHAHQKGIIHRDIKPSNVLVTFIGESPVPKVIDFGIAKAISGQLSAKTVFTAFEMLIGTPEYMSPEQASMATSDVDTRSDIYSLGVLLYELLTGTTPFDTNRLFKSGLDEVRRVIRQVEPTKPSTRLAVAPPADANLISTRRKTDPVRLVRLIKGDLDWIALKALEKSPSRRYQTAAAFADDLRHYLSSEPILARPPSPAYRFRKLVQRNKVLVGAGIAIVLSLVLGLAAAIYSLGNERLAVAEAEAARNRALQDRRVALEEAAKSRQVTKFLGEMLQSVGPSVAVGRDTSLLREVADRTAERVGVDLTNQPAVQGEIWHMLGGVYRELGAYARAEKMLKYSLDKRETNPTSSTNLAALYQDLALVLLYQHSLPEAERFLLKAATLREAGLSNLNSPEAVTAFEMLAMLRWKQGRVQEAEQMMTAVVQRRRELLPPDHPDYSSGLINLANTVFTGGKFAEAEKIYREALALVRKNRGEENPTMALLLQNIATTIAEQGRPADAKPMYELAAKMRKKLLGENHPSFITSLDSIADMQRLLGNHAEAETLYKESFDLSRKSQGLAHPSSIRSLGYLSSALLEQKKFAELETLLNDVLTPEFASIPASVPVLSMRTEFLARSGRWREATQDARAALAFDRNDHMRYHTLAPLLAIQNLQDDYRALCLEISRRFSDTSNAFVADRMAKDCIILPLPDLDLGPIRAMADVAIAKGTNLPAAPFFYVCKAATEMRSGNYPSAESWANKALTSPYSYSAVEGLAIVAIAQKKQGKREESSANLAAARKIIREQFPTIEKGDLGADWRDWIIAHILTAEVETLE